MLYREKTIYKTPDGKTFDSLQQVERHYSDLFGNLLDKIVGNNTNPLRIKSSIHNNRKELFNILRMEFENNENDQE